MIELSDDHNSMGIPVWHPCFGTVYITECPRKYSCLWSNVKCSIEYVLCEHCFSGVVLISFSSTSDEHDLTPVDFCKRYCRVRLDLAEHF